MSYKVRVNLTKFTTNEIGCLMSVEGSGLLFHASCPNYKFSSNFHVKGEQVPDEKIESLFKYVVTNEINNDFVLLDDDFDVVSC